jgi:hypothetical protein
VISAMQDIIKLKINKSRNVRRMRSTVIFVNTSHEVNLCIQVSSHAMSINGTRFGNDSENND